MSGAVASFHSSRIGKIDSGPNLLVLQLLVTTRETSIRTAALV